MPGPVQFELFWSGGLLDRNGDHLGVWRVGADHMIVAARDELERVLARREAQHRSRNVRASAFPLGGGSP